MASQFPIYGRISQTERHEELKNLVAAVSQLYAKRTSNPEEFGVSTIQLTWKGGVLDLIRVIDETTLKPSATCKHEP